jgi:hypothetical protein
LVDLANHDYIACVYHNDVVEADRHNQAFIGL